MKPSILYHILFIAKTLKSTIIKIIKPIKFISIYQLT